jgi:hypothetical protein
MSANISFEYGRTRIEVIQYSCASSALTQPPQCRPLSAPLVPGEGPSHRVALLPSRQHQR